MKSGNDVTVLAGYPHYPEWRPLQRRRPWSRTPWQGATLVRRFHFIPRSPSALKRAAYESSLAVGAIASLPTIRPRPDVILGFSPALADGVTAVLAARAYGCRSAVVFQDLMGVGARESGIQGGERVSGLVSKIEAIVARRADAVGYASDGFADSLSRVGARRLRRMFNWSQLRAPTRTREDTRERYGWGSAFVCTHGGNIGEKQGLEVIVDAAEMSPSTIFVLVGDGNQRSRLEGLIQRKSLRNVRFLGSLGDSEYANVLMASDVLLLTQRASIKRMSLPSKLHSYLAAGLPIVAAVAADSEAADALARQSAAILIRPSSPVDLVAAISGVVNRGPRDFPFLPSRDSALEEYSALLEDALSNARDEVEGLCALKPAISRSEGKQ